MTNKEAIEFLKNISSEEAGRCIGNEGTFYAELMMYHVEALHLAIKALEERPKGKWEYTNNGIIYCNICNHYLGFRGNFCPNCGADMRGDV